MRKVVIGMATALAVFGACDVQAQHRHYHGGGGGGGRWIAPLVGGLIVGGIAGSVLSQPSYAAPPPVYVQPDPAYRVECFYRPAYDVYGRYVGERRICERYPNF